ncbi:Cytokinin dehydrogenase 3 [Nymphaea thermarum]|nr:Cytokinin dehydrogenase 3 [Nymphaea thermarum]
MSVTAALLDLIPASLSATMVGPHYSWLGRLPSEISEHITVDPTAILDASTDFGSHSQAYPAAVLLPTSINDIVNLVRHSYQSQHPFPVSAKGHAHSTHGQAQAQDGVVIEMMSLKEFYNFGCCSAAEGSWYVDVGGGQLWIEVLHETIKVGLAPRSWTDYLYLTVGGTLSNGGISGQSFLQGPQISNVLEMDIVTGKGELLTCSSMHNSDLFFAVLGGLGQFGIITKARIALEKAPDMVRWVRMLYSNFYEFTKDQEHLISLKGEEGFNYLEGFVKMADENGGGDGIDSRNWKPPPFAFPEKARARSTTLYYLEVCKYYDSSSQEHVDEDVERLISELHYMPGMLAMKDVSYVDFLNRVHQDELEFRSKGLWNVPHPWLCVFVPRSRIMEFHDVVFKGILSQKKTPGPIIIYPMNKNKWDEKMSAAVPAEDVFYSVSLLRSAAHDWEVYEEQNMEILSACEKRKMGLKAYLPHYKEEREWKEHFGERWDTLLDRKLKFDPTGILATGQKIFRFPLVSSNSPHQTAPK